MAKNTREPYNPLDKLNLGKSVATAIIEQSLSNLPPEPLVGAGIYAIYYFGDNPLYELLSEFNRSDEKIGWPIYVGKAIPSGGRKGVFSKVAKGKALYTRLHKHSKSISECENLNLDHFKCRYLTIDSIWIPLGEQLLIDKYKPIWNSIIDGFGNNDPGKNRYGGKMSDWDKLHPGRDWTKKMTSFKPEYEDSNSLKEKIRLHQIEMNEKLSNQNSF